MIDYFLVLEVMAFHLIASIVVLSGDHAYNVLTSLLFALFVLAAWISLVLVRDGCVNLACSMIREENPRDLAGSRRPS